MEEQKKFYWLKLKRDFFKRHDIQIIEGMPNGKDYVLFYLKLMCESIDHKGNLRFSDTIPYNEQMLSTITNTNIDIVRSALQLFRELGKVEILDDQTIYMTEVEKLIGSAVDNENANRQRRFREKQKELALCERYESVTKNNESKSIELDIDKDIELDKEKEKKTPLTPKGEKKIIEQMISEFAAGDCEIEELLNDWLKNRKANRAPNTERAIRYNLDKIVPCAAESGMSINEYLREVICRGWRSFYAIKNFNKTQTNKDIIEEIIAEGGIKDDIK